MIGSAPSILADVSSAYLRAASMFTNRECNNNITIEFWIHYTSAHSYRLIGYAQSREMHLCWPMLSAEIIIGGAHRVEAEVRDPSIGDGSRYCCLFLAWQHGCSRVENRTAVTTLGVIAATVVNQDRCFARIQHIPVIGVVQLDQGVVVVQ